jgi:hypothetical protein
VRKLLLIVPILLIGLYVGADIGLKSLAEARVAQQLKSSLGLQADPKVSLGGFPFLPKFFSGKFPSVTIADARGTGTGQHVPFAQGDMTLRDVRFSPSRLVFGDRTSITAMDGDGHVDLTQADVNAIVRQRAAAVTVTLRDGKIQLSATGLARPIVADVVVSDGHLSLSTGAATLKLSVALPQVVPGVRYTSADVIGNMLRVRFTIDHASITV